VVVEGRRIREARFRGVVGGVGREGLGGGGGGP